MFFYHGVPCHILLQVLHIGTGFANILVSVSILLNVLFQ